MNKRILGLDTGTNSLGWAVVDWDEHAQSYELIKYGDVIFQEGVKIEKGIESSKAAERSGYKAIRKQYFRRRLRKIQVLKVLVKYHLCPYLSDDDLRQWHLQKQYPKSDELMLWQRTSDEEGKNPYYDRHRCLHEKLDLTVEADRYILGRALYHLTQRRGFLSNRLDTSADNKEDGVVKWGISQLSTEMEEAGCEYLGDYFYKLYDEQGNKVRIRQRYTDRNKHYQHEFDAICEKQELSSELIEDLQRAIFFQLPLKSQRHGVGRCTFERGKPRCADSHPDYEEFRMLCFVNNIQVKGPHDLELRPLTYEEREKIEPLFFRKSKPNFDFEDIAKALAGKKNYAWIHDKEERAYKFNYRMTQGVPGCPTIAQLKSIFGDDWKTGIAETYTLVQKKNGSKSLQEMVDDVWNVLYSFSSVEKLKEFAHHKLQLDEESAEKFAKIKLSRSFAALSLKAIRKFLPFLRKGMYYTHASFFANIPTIVGKEIWNNEQNRKYIMENVGELVFNYQPKHREVQGTIEMLIKDFLANNFELPAGATDKLYHPSMIETYPNAQRNEFGILQLGSPRTNAIRNPMAMRSLHILRRVVNQLLKESIIDENTEVHVEYARELNDANKRRAIADRQKEQDRQHKKYGDEIRKLYKEETGKEIEPTQTDMLKFQLWEEQNHHCLYTGEQIGITDFIGSSPKFDIEHTIPQSVGGDSTQMNLTLCDNRFNREVKKAKLPTELANHEEILTRIEPWKNKYEQLVKERDKQRTFAGMDKAVKDIRIQKRHKLQMEIDYWRGKYERFTMTEVPEGFSRRQGTGIGLISRYAGLYLKSLFHQADSRNKSNVYVVKGVATAEFRKMWGLQSEYEKKCRDNHSHHCMDAITIACIGKREYDLMAEYYRMEETFKQGRGSKPKFSKPWATFTEDVLNIYKNLLVVHDTTNNMLKHTKKYVQTSKGKVLAQGDTARGSLHLDTYYGAIERDGEIRYVVRRPLSSFTKPEELENIVDETVKRTIKEAIADKNFKQAIAEPIYMNEDKGILIKKVRCFANSVKKPINIRQHRDLSKKEYKQQYHVVNENNYMLAIYEGLVKNKVVREFEIVSYIEAAKYYKRSQDRNIFSSIVPTHSTKYGLPLKTKLLMGQMVLMFEENPDEIQVDNTKDLVKRLYKVVGIEKDGRIKFKHHQEARKEGLPIFSTPYKNNDDYAPIFRQSINNINILVDGIDFTIDILGKVTLKE